MSSITSENENSEIEETKLNLPYKEINLISNLDNKIQENAENIQTNIENINLSYPNLISEEDNLELYLKNDDVSMLEDYVNRHFSNLSQEEMINKLMSLDESFREKLLILVLEYQQKISKTDNLNPTNNLNNNSWNENKNIYAQQQEFNIINNNPVTAEEEVQLETINNNNFYPNNQNNTNNYINNNLPGINLNFNGISRNNNQMGYNQNYSNIQSEFVNNNNNNNNNLITNNIQNNLDHTNMANINNIEGINNNLMGNNPNSSLPLGDKENQLNSSFKSNYIFLLKLFFR